MPELYIGIMSGTSLDGVDGVLIDFESVPLRVLAFASQPLPDALKTDFLRLNQSADNELHRAALAANALVRVYAQVASGLLNSSGLRAQDVAALGAHGQTVRHRPGEFDGTGYTLQLNNPALLAELTGIDVVADFRSRDVAAGGQGAPLVPPFHQAVFSRPGTPVAVLNIGGISNVTLLAADSTAAVTGFDCGPGNALMDEWCYRHTGAPFDGSGRWAAGGVIHAGLLTRMLDEAFFARKPPKSTGRDLFNPAWLQQLLADYVSLAAQDVQATLAELTAKSCALALLENLPDCRELFVCGGGALNEYLMSRLQHHLPGCRVSPTDAAGLPSQQVEAAAFAWLARQNIRGETGSLKSVTGALGARILGALYRA